MKKHLTYKYPEDNRGNKFTVSIKDNLATKDAPTTASSKILEKFTTHYDSTVVKLLKENNVFISSKTVLDEFGMGGTGLHAHTGKIHNPLNEDYIIGGSSSGAAASMVLDDIDAAIGSDSGDSVRLPASFVDKIGYKPSYGAVSRYGLFQYVSSLDTVGWMTNNIKDTFKLSKILYRKCNNDMTSIDVKLNDKLETKKPKKVSIIWEKKSYKEYINVKFQKVIDKLKESGVEVEVIEPNYDLIDSLLITYMIISFSEATSNLANLTGISFGNKKQGSTWKESLINTRTEGFGNLIKKRLVLGTFFSHNENQKELFLPAKKARRLQVDWYNKILDNTDLLIFPTFTSIPRTIKNIEDNKRIFSSENMFSSLLLFANFAGSPSISMPLGKHEGLPFGISLNTKRFDDQELLDYSSYFEELLGGLND
ncbi:MAG: amidase family protein [Mycoplasma sp.]|nr:amidase family protein [Mycoplasma sp.]